MSNNATPEKTNARLDESLRGVDVNIGENPLDQGRSLFSAACAQLWRDASAAEMGAVTPGSDAELLEKELLALVGAEGA